MFDRLLRSAEARASTVEEANCGTTMAANIARIIATISSSTKVNPDWLPRLGY